MRLSWKSSSCILLALSFVVVTAAPASAQAYHVTDLGLGSFGANGYTLASSINNAGQVAGFSTGQCGLPNAVLWTPASPNGTDGSLQDLGALPDIVLVSHANALNDAGDVVGDSAVLP